MVKADIYRTRTFKHSYVSIVEGKSDIVFVFETLSAITVLVLFGVMLEDSRVVICPILFWMWLDSRLSDAICVFYHSNHRGSLYQKSRILTLVTGLFTFVVVFSLLALPVVLIVQAIPNMDLSLGFNLRGIYVPFTNNNYTTSTDAPIGTYAQVRLYAVVSDFLLTFTILSSLDFITDLLRSRKSAVRLRYIRLPVKRILLPRFTIKSESTTIVPHGTLNVMSEYETVINAENEEADDIISEPSILVG